MTRTQTYQQTVVIEDCCVCGGPIAMEVGQQDNLRHTHKTFYCPVGHTQSYIGETDGDKLVKAQDKLAASEATVNRFRA